MLKNIKSIILSIIATIALCVMLCSTFFVQYAMYDNYFLLFPMSVGVSLVSIVALLSFFVREGNFRLSLPDILISILVIYYAARYDYQLQLANWKIVYAVLLLILWFAIRILFANIVISRAILYGGIVAIGCMQVVWGLLQLYGVLPSNHNLFAITGSFYNPGPYSGYLAMIFPIALCCLLQSVGKARYLWLLAFSLMICIIPAGMSRSAWLALLVSSIWVLVIHYKWISKIRVYIKSHWRVGIVCGVVLLCIFLTVLISIFQLKADSAYGRLFIWKNTCEAMFERPMLGYGPGSFPRVYGNVQSDYFATGDYTELEERVAGSPEYAFNEYLQLCIEGGGILLVLFMVLVFFCLRQGIRNKEYAACSGLISLLMFSLSSYPFQLLPFLKVGVVLLVVCITIKNKDEILRQKSILFILFSTVIVAVSITMSIFLYKIQKGIAKWNDICFLYDKGLYKDAILICEDSYHFHKHDSNYLLRYARCLIKEERCNEACEILDRAKEISCYPLIWTMQGKCFQSMGNYDNAEKCFKKAVNLLPSRHYPYYLLAQLYAEPSFFHNNEMKKMVKIVLTKKPKVPSKAIDEMRIDARRLLYKNN